MGAIGGTVDTAAFGWSHMLQVPIFLVLNSIVAYFYVTKARKSERLDRWRPLMLHLVGTVLLLIQPIFDTGGLIDDMKNGLPGSQDVIRPPKLTQGGFWHHGYLMAFFSVSGILCIICASLMAAGVHEKAAKLLKEKKSEGYSSLA
eukprot:gnl/MRDRNA2_/MRDRNA2_102636_c0_seq1.p1 gnl/MRDRNA2_/MRDRNA2_102636_c0~~gnl/MRDRNA2_/MRDRNA2_102636_c0_seq1.p1  ORF type:complete len:146 (-),score=30.65 gnl/MRDRNA2_/MRDRNA2_102636_c0_seq1:155-592(-)